jgi:ParB family chromosome partitioning protein
MEHAAQAERRVLATNQISPDPKNRRILKDEDFQSLVDSIRVLGVLQPLHVRPLDEDRFEIVDGERRWRAANEIGLREVPCDVWTQWRGAEAVMAGLALNEQRKQHGCLHVARRLRELKNELGLSHEEVAARTGLPLDRVKTYFALFGGSDFLLSFFENEQLPMKVAAEFVRYEKATSEGAARRLVLEHGKQPMTAGEIAALRKRRDKVAGEKKTAASSKQSSLIGRLEKALQDNAQEVVPELERMLARAGYRLTAASEVRA